MLKQNIQTIHEKNSIIENIISVMVNRRSFLLCGHSNPDEDCIASMVAMALLLIRFDKMVQIYLAGNIPENINYLLNICKYNSIEIVNQKRPIKRNTDTIIICDTPKLSMLDSDKRIDRLLQRRDILKVEIDHHIGGDSEYIGDKGYCLVTTASSASELIGFLALKLKKKRELLNRFLISDPLSRNFVLSIITGIIGDTNMGLFLKSKKEKIYYNIFSHIFNDILMKTTIRETNFTSSNEIFDELHKLTEVEEKCYITLMRKHRILNSIGYLILNRDDMKSLCMEFDNEIISSITKSIANDLAEKTKRISLIAYYENDAISNLIQFRVRRSHQFKVFDLRNILEMFSITNGGGHEGAIGFRFPKSSINNLEEYVTEMIRKLGKKLENQ